MSSYCYAKIRKRTVSLREQMAATQNHCSRACRWHTASGMVGTKLAVHAGTLDLRFKVSSGCSAGRHDGSPRPPARINWKRGGTDQLFGMSTTEVKIFNAACSQQDVDEEQQQILLTSANDTFLVVFRSFVFSLLGLGLLFGLSVKSAQFLGDQLDQATGFIPSTDV
ncbi:hypothetical protein C8F01DRAFT_1087419 [Mycena amicta]|nr:hypothetical protein C8F01DRAFT_1087419 [Mycena amicta]